MKLEVEQICTEMDMVTDTVFFNPRSHRVRESFIRLLLILEIVSISIRNGHR